MTCHAIHPARRATAPRRGHRPGGFTLIELLVVMAVIALLISIVLPSYRSVKQQAYAQQSAANINGLETAIDQFKQDTGYYPGEKEWAQRGQDGELHDIEGNNSYRLAAVLCSRKGRLYNPDEPYDGYLAATDKLLGENGQIIDGFPEPMEIMYFVSVAQYRNSGDPVEQFRGPSDAERRNPQANLPDGAGLDRFADFIRSNGDGVYGHGSYLLIAAGPDREFFTDDDITNFNRNRE